MSGSDDNFSLIGRKVPTVIVEVRGGVVNSVYSDQQIRVLVLDHDDYQATTNQEDRQWFVEVEEMAKGMTDYCEACPSRNGQKGGE